MTTTRSAEFLSILRLDKFDPHRPYQFFCASLLRSLAFGVFPLVIAIRSVSHGVTLVSRHRDSVWCALACNAATRAGEEYSVHCRRCTYLHGLVLNNPDPRWYTRAISIWVVEPQNAHERRTLIPRAGPLPVSTKERPLQNSRPQMTGSLLTKNNIETRLQTFTAELLDLECTLMAGDLDSRVLRDFRDAVDYVRKSAWAVQEWQDRQAKDRDTSTVLPLLTFERIRRATELCKRIAIELDDCTAEGMKELSEAVDVLRWRLSGH